MTWGVRVRRALSGMVWLVGLIAMANVGRAQTPQPVPYFNNFETSVSAGWSLARFTSTAQLTRFLGDFGRNGNAQEETTLVLATAAGAWREGGGMDV